MILDRYAKRVIFTPPRTGSRNLHKVLTTYPEVLEVQGPNPQGWIDHHYTGLTFETKTFHKVLVVRNPLTRFRSLWSWFLQFDINSKRITFDEWLKGIVDDDESFNWIYRYSICRWIGGTPYDEVWHLEDIEKPVNEYYPRVKMLSKYLLQPPKLVWGDRDLKQQVIEKMMVDDAETFNYNLNK